MSETSSGACLGQSKISAVLNASMMTFFQKSLTTELHHCLLMLEVNKTKTKANEEILDES